MATKKYVGENALLYFWGKIKNLVGTKVDKVDGKGLSTNDYTTSEKTKPSGAVRLSVLPWMRYSSC